MSFFSKSRQTDDWSDPLPELDDDKDIIEAVVDAVSVVKRSDHQVSNKPRRQTAAATTSPAEDQVVQPVGDAVDVPKRLRAIARQVQTERKRLAGSVILIGQRLSEAQDLLASYAGGSFNRWLDEACGFSRITAYKYLAAWRVFGACEPGLQARFEVSALTSLAADKTPQAARDEALQLASDGQAITGKLAKQLIAKHSPARTSRPKTLSLVFSGGAVVIRSRPGQDVVGLLEAALAEARKTRSAAAA